jgi:hypothetical protein
MDFVHQLWTSMNIMKTGYPNCENRQVSSSQLNITELATASTPLDESSTTHAMLGAIAHPLESSINYTLVDESLQQIDACKLHQNECKRVALRDFTIQVVAGAMYKFELDVLIGAANSTHQVSCTSHHLLFTYSIINKELPLRQSLHAKWPY